MTKLCMIGDSHVAAMRLAWNEVQQRHPEIDATIYGAHSNKLVTASVSADGHMSFDGPPFLMFRAGDEPNRARSIPLQDFDAFAIVGSFFGPVSVFRAYNRFYYSGLKGVRTQLLTREMFVRAAMRNSRTSASLIVAQLIRNTVEKPIYLVPTPLPSEKGYLDFNKSQLEPFQAAERVGDSEALLAIYDEVCDELHRQGISVLPQHESTKASPVSTFQRYTENSIRLRPDLDIPHPEDDYVHMNEVYGAIMWEALIAAIVPQTQDAAAP